MRPALLVALVPALVLGQAKPNTSSAAAPTAYCSAGRTSTQTNFTHGGNIDISMDTEYADTHGMCAAPGGTSAWTATVPPGLGGTWELCVLYSVDLPGAVTGLVAIDFNVNGSNVHQACYTPIHSGLGAGGAMCQGCSSRTLAAGDVVKMQLYQSTGATRSTDAFNIATAYRTRVLFRRVGD